MVVVGEEIMVEDSMIEGSEAAGVAGGLEIITAGDRNTFQVGPAMLDGTDLRDLSRHALRCPLANARSQCSWKIQTSLSLWRFQAGNVYQEPIQVYLHDGTLLSRKCRFTVSLRFVSRDGMTAKIKLDFGVAASLITLYGMIGGMVQGLYISRSSDHRSTVVM